MRTGRLRRRRRRLVVVGQLRGAPLSRVGGRLEVGPRDLHLVRRRGHRRPAFASRREASLRVFQGRRHRRRQGALHPVHLLQAEHDRDADLSPRILRRPRPRETVGAHQRRHHCLPPRYDLILETRHRREVPLLSEGLAPTGRQAEGGCHGLRRTHRAGRLRRRPLLRKGHLRRRQVRRRHVPGPHPTRQGPGPQAHLVL
mmetsp:Transcript_35700/g.114209  ORF Transcript_35700/g.114209 Transcript_35700/m.114209 type:complete len:200 (+) Transcript_35700:667-1266(+)